jgi:hypothetical protein
VIAALFKNSGATPADGATVEQRVFIDGVEDISKCAKDRPSRILPGAAFDMKTEVGMREYDAVMSGRINLEFKTTVKYDWFSGSEEKCYYGRFDPDYQTVFDLGDCTPDK